MQDDYYGNALSAAQGVAVGRALGSARNMEMSRPSLQAFEAKVGQVRALLESSSHDTKANGVVQAAGFGVGFDEAASVARAMETVHSNIVVLHDMIVQRLEIMALTIKMAGDKTEEADEANRAKLTQLLIQAGQQTVTAPGMPTPDETRRSVT